MPPLLLITTVIINSNYVQQSCVSRNCWTPALSLTIVLTDICNPQLSAEVFRPQKKRWEDIVQMRQDREDVDGTDRTGQDGSLLWSGNQVAFQDGKMLLKVGCLALPCTSRVKIVSALQQPRLYEERTPEGKSSVQNVFIQRMIRPSFSDNETPELWY